MKIIYKFMSVLLIGVLLPIAALGYVAYVSMNRISVAATEKSVKTMLAVADVRLRDDTQDKADDIDRFFQEYYSHICVFKRFFESEDANYQLFNPPFIPEVNLYAESKQTGLPAYGYIHPVCGAYADFDRKGKGSPFIPKRVVDRLKTDEKYRADIAVILNKVMLMTDMFCAVTEENKDTLDLAWIVTDVGVTNVSPPYDYARIIEKDPGVVNIDESEKDYVRLLNPQNNPSRATKWLEPYLDQFRGMWMTSCVAPLYRGDTFLGTTGVDILLPTITDRILKTRVGEKGYVFLIARTGKVIAIPETGIRDLLWDDLHKKAFRETCLPSEKQKWTPEMVAAVAGATLDQNPDPAVRKVVFAMKNGETGVVRLTLSGEEKLIAFAPIKNPGWGVGVVVPLQELIAPSRDIQKTIAEGSAHVIYQFTLFAVLIVIIIITVGMCLHYQVLRPLAGLTDKIARVRWETMEFNGHGVQRKDEIGQLYAKFSEMLMVLKKTRDEVTEKAGLLKSINDDLQAKSAALFASNRELERAQDALKKWGEELEYKVAERTRELELTQDKLVRTEKLAALGKLAGSLSHELRNPLGVIANAIYYLTLPGIKADVLSERESIYIIKRQVEMANRIIENALDFANPKPLEMEKGMINRTMDTVIADTVIPRGIKIEREYKGMRETLYDPYLIQQLFSNIIRNSVQAIKNEGKITISTSDEKEGVKVVIGDTGSGIARDDLDKVSEPLFSRKPRGIGLGLYIAKGIVERHKGILRIESEEGKGTVVTVQLPYGNSA